MSCSDNVGDNEKVYTLSSQDVITEVYDNLDTTAITEKNTAVLKLEATKGHENDTKGVGSDEVMFYTPSAESRTFCLEDNESSGHTVSIKDANGTILTEVSNGCKTLDLDSGYYAIDIINADANNDIEHTVFITSTQNNSSTFSGIYSDVDSVDDRAVENKDLEKTTLISFNVCKNCNLLNIKLHNLSFDSNFDQNNLSPRMNDAYFTKLGVSEFDFFSIQNQNENHSKKPLDLTGSTLYGADLTYSVFRDAIFDGVNLEDANLSHAVFIDCSFYGTVLKNVDMTKAVFIRPKYRSSVEIESHVISRVSSTQLIQTNKFVKDWVYYAYQYIASFLIDEKTMGLYIKNVIDKTIKYRTVKAPKGLSFISSPDVVRINNYQGYYVFASMSDGNIYSFSSLVNDWVVLNGSDKCKSAPVASSWNIQNDDSKEQMKTKLIAICHDKVGKLFTWEGTFELANDHTPWINNEYGIDSFDVDISMDSAGNIAYVKDDTLYIKHINGLANNGEINREATISNTDITGSENIHFISNVNLELFSANKAVVMSDGYLYLGNASNYFSRYNPPTNGFIAMPIFFKREYKGGDIYDSKFNERKLMSVNGDGELYYLHYDTTRDWGKYSVNDNIEETTRESDLTFRDSTLDFTYFEDTSFYGLDFSKTKLSHLFFYKVDATKSSFIDLSIPQSYFYDSVFEWTDFSGVTFDEIDWEKNKFYLTVFDGSTFSDKELVSIDNEFFSLNQLIHIKTMLSSFKEVNNLPLELITGSDKFDISNATDIEWYDFTGSSFKNIDKLNFKNLDLIELHLEHTDISGIDANGTVIHNSSFAYANIKDTIFDNTSLVDSSFYQANIVDSSFSGATWKNVDASYGHFQGSDMKKMTIDSSKLDHASFNKSDMSFSSFIGSTSALYGSFIDTILSAAKLSDIDFSNSDFTGANFDSIYDWDLYEQQDTDLSGSVFKNVHFNDAYLRCSDMRGVNLSGASFQDANLSGADLSSLPTPEGSYFVSADFSGVNFQDTDLGDSNLRDSEFDFTGRIISFGDGLHCTGYTTKPKTSSATTCQDGEKPQTECSLH